MKLFVGFLLFLVLIQAAVTQKNVVCYWQGIIDAGSIHPSICTHIIYSFLGVEENGEINFLTLGDIEGSLKLSSLVSLRKQNPSLFVMAAIGGANDELSKAFSTLSASNVTRSAFVTNVIYLMRRHSLSGIDIDWEFPNSVDDKKNLILLLQDLKIAFASFKYILSVAVAPDKRRAELFYDIPELSRAVDFINLMTYDFHGSWDTTVGHHAQMYPHHRDSDYIKEVNGAASVSYWLSKGAAAYKLHFGIPTFGNIFVLSDLKKHKIGSDVDVIETKKTSGNLGYNEYCETKSTGWKQHYDTNYRAYYAINGFLWFGFDGVQQVVAKTKYTKSNNLGGVMFWSLDTDDYTNNCNGGNFALISTASKEINN